jgi:hypothetical protein
LKEVAKYKEEENRGLQFVVKTSRFFKTMINWDTRFAAQRSASPACAGSA